MSYEALGSINYQNGINSSAALLSPASQVSLSAATWNTIITGTGDVRPWAGPTSQGAGTGSRKQFVFANTYGGISDIGLVVGSGSFFESIGRSRWGIGAGQPSIEGVAVSGFTLSTNLQLQIPVAGVYGTPVQAGLAQPSAPEVGIIQTTGYLTNSMSAKIARSRPSTGAVSVASPTSNVIQPQANQMRVTFPIAATGQTAWRVYFTFQGFGGTGVHYLGSYAGETDILEATIAAGTIDGIARSLAFNFQDGDLIPIESSFDDYPPPAATHAIQLQTVLNLAGCYSDSTTSPTTTDPGTAVAVSKENNYESYVPTSLLFLPEQVVDTLARPLDDYGYIGCQNSIHAIQYVGNRGDELPSCTITTVLPDIGVQYPHNWCYFRGQLLIYTAQGNLMLMSERGEFDTSFAGPVSNILKTFTTATTAVGYDPQNDAIVVFNGSRVLFYSLASGQWRQIWLPDFGLTGTTISCTAAKRNLYFTVDTVAYSFDTGSSTAPCSFVCNYQNLGSNGSVKDIYEMAVSATSLVADDFAVCISKNNTLSQFRSISISSGSPTITDADAQFYSGMVGKKVILFCDNVDGSNDVFRGLVGTYTDSDTISLTDADGDPFSPSVTATKKLMFIGDWADIRDFGTGNFANFFPSNVVEARSYQVATWFKASGSEGNILAVEPFGTVYSSSRAQ